MTVSNLAVVIITFNRNALLEICLQSVKSAFLSQAYPLYVVVQDLNSEDQNVLQKFSSIITQVFSVESGSQSKEKLINDNRVLAWDIALIQQGHEYVLCLEDDVEVAEDIMNFSEKVIRQNSDNPSFFGINYGSYEINQRPNTYSKLRYGIHGPASLISQRSFLRMKTKRLNYLQGLIAWDSWVEPIAKIGYMATSNTARYIDHGVNGTHTSEFHDRAYFEKLLLSYNVTKLNKSLEVINLEAVHTWRDDCVNYKSSDNLKYRLKLYRTRLIQFTRLLFKS
ncbi:MAG: hypothetical protein RJA33_31 [Actinomycetota bacterium]|jgi:hypothetical protein